MPLYRAVRFDRHRVAKASGYRHSGSDAVRFLTDHLPDYVGREPDEPPY